MLNVGSRMHGASVAVFLALTLAVAGCKKGDANLGQLYSRNLTLRHVRASELEAILGDVAAATRSSRKDVREDLDGSDMFIYSNNDLVIFIRRKFDEPCDQLGCAWKVNVSPADTTLSETSQKRIVDAAFSSVVGLGAIQAHSR